MIFSSILYPENGGAIATETCEAPAFFRDLNLDQVVEAMTANSKEYELASFFYLPLRNLESIAYRQEVMEDLEDSAIMQAVRTLSERMREMRTCLTKAEKLHDYQYALERWFLYAADLYIGGVQQFTEALKSDRVRSRGLLAFGEYLSAYTSSEVFQKLSAEVNKLKSDLSSIQYCLLLRNGAVTVSRYDGEEDYSTAVDEAFRKFCRLAAPSYRMRQRGALEINHIQSQVLDRLALLYPDIFHALDQFCSSHRDFLNATIVRFDREIQFYVVYLVHIEKLQRAGVRFCRPKLSQVANEIFCHAAVDLALASRLIGQRTDVVPNDFYLSGPERVLVVSGPNQGGKTTFARMFGQIHYLASLGCLVPGTDAHLFLFDQIFTHFERCEDITNLRGKLQDDLLRIRRILESATSNSLILLNEVFSSTTVSDAVYLSKRVMEQITELDAHGVWVTFLEELASFNEKTVSIVSMIEPENPAIRTFKLQRRPPDGLAYAVAIARKHRVTHDCLMERING